jgi:hypothetical protein
MAKQTYRTFLLRLWPAASEGQGGWRASLEDAHSGERRGFSDLLALHGFLRSLLETHPGGRAPGEACEAVRSPAVEG